MQIPASPLTGSEHNYRVVPSALCHYIADGLKQTASLLDPCDPSPRFSPTCFSYTFFSSPIFLPVSLICKYQGIPPWFESCSYTTHTCMKHSCQQLYHSDESLHTVFVQPRIHEERSQSPTVSYVNATIPSWTMSL